MTTYCFIAEGFEETEAIVPVDLLKRAGANVKLVSITESKYVTGSHGITIATDIFCNEVNPADIEAIILPGGSVGTENLAASEWVKKFASEAYHNGVIVSAICAAPSVLGRIGVLDLRSIACYPGTQKYMPTANVTGKKVVRDDNIITAEGMGVSYEFGITLVAALFGDETAERIKEQTRYGG